MKELDRIYRKRKQQILPLIFGFAAFFVLFRVIIPQMSDIQDTQGTINKKSADIEAKKATVRLLNSVAPDVIDSNYSLVTTALPVQKDVVLIYSELTSAATDVGVELGGFSVKVGDVYSAEGASEDDKKVTGIPFLNILVRVEGDGENLRRFADKMYKSIPLVEISSVDISKTEARYDINFYYKPITARPAGADTLGLQPLTEAEDQQLATLQEWQPQSLLR